ncbi:MAG: hypothetical protein WBO55_05885 [Rhizobiaceae bacterium]
MAPATPPADATGRSFRNSMRAGAILIAAALLAGCTGSGDALRGVGARQQVKQPADSLIATQTLPPPVNLPSELGRTSKIDPQEGLSLNVAGAAPSRNVVDAQIPDQPQMGASRQDAVADIRTKAKATGDSPPNVFDVKRPAVQQLSLTEQQRLKAELEAAAAQNCHNDAEEGCNPQAQ